MKKGKTIVSLFILVIMLFLAACSNDTTAPTSSVENEGKETNEDAEIVYIGYSGPLSGPAAYYGENTLSGLQLAEEEINKEGFEVNGKKYNIQIVSLDDKYMPNEAAANAKRLVQENKTPIIYNPHSGGIAAMQVFNEQDQFIVAAYSSEPDITQVGNSLTVRIPPTYDGYIEPFTKYAMERFGPKIASLPTATQYGKDWSEALLPYWESKGGEVVYNTAIDFSKETDFFTILTNALKDDPDVLFIGGASEPTAKLAIQARELGFEGGFIVMDQAKLDEMKAISGSYETLEGAIGTMPLIFSDYPGTKPFIDSYQAKFNKDPGSEAGFHYLSLFIFVEAMKAAGSVDDAKLIHEHMQDGIDSLPEDKKVYVVEEIDENGGFNLATQYGVIEDGAVAPVE
ncbi:branched-chain amino acid ABC transporter substrate-binding protein [Robertmurraya siralis]|uniref:Branched-chain amino acid ABC transporter substrate-binding protein n=1 Tax=Robertmurraya siralis TaxID=77777 RepID=A0A919WIX9_9BACI|nr:ABC transporter substrate-binding protein [Robertmurraya siralis]GIN62566.1 branched-chain amino acid ABC transporter substrate-binding protein [Robertmurraya siralis]